jgi:hypothetical protein
MNLLGLPNPKDSRKEFADAMKARRETVKDNLIAAALTGLSESGRPAEASPQKDAVLAAVLKQLDMFGQPLLDECGQCGGYHPIGYTAECRDNAFRFPTPYGDED